MARTMSVTGMPTSHARCWRATRDPVSSRSSNASSRSYFPRGIVISDSPPSACALASAACAARSFLNSFHVPFSFQMYSDHVSGGLLAAWPWGTGLVDECMRIELDSAMGAFTLMVHGVRHLQLLQGGIGLPGRKFSSRAQKFSASNARGA